MPAYGDASYMGALNVARTEAVPVCGIAKAINADSLSAGPLAEVSRRIGAVLSANGSALAPLVELCR